VATPARLAVCATMPHGSDTQHTMLLRAHKPAHHHTAPRVNKFQQLTANNTRKSVVYRESQMNQGLDKGKYNKQYICTTRFFENSTVK